MSNRRYVYSITNRASLALLCILVVAGLSLVIRALAGADADWVLKRIAWPVWALAFVLRAVQWALRRRAEGR
jgi:hypothetical protein